MARRPLPPVPEPEVSADAVETQFYRALQRADLEALMALWADDDEIVCVHPGGGRLIGAAAIRASFAAIFGNGGIPVRHEQVHRVQHIGCALHHLVERIEVPAKQGTQTAWVLATNLYLKTVQGWRLAAHHASPGSLQEPAPHGDDAPTTLH